VETARTTRAAAVAFVIALVTGAASACTSSSPIDAPALDDGGVVEASTTPAEADGGDAPHDERASCAVAAVPAAVRTDLSLSPFYAKHVDLAGFSIVASSKTPDAALCVARDVLVRMFAHRPELRARLAQKKIRLAIMAKSELTTDIPEHSDLTPKEYWDKRARGLGATLDRPAVSAAEENVLCYATDVYKGESILVHEVSHAIFDIGIALYEPTMQARLDAAYAAAMKAGRFADTYAATNASEYWAEGVQDWFDTNLTVSPPNGVHGPIHTRAQLKTYDPDLAALIAEVFGDDAWRYACPAP
jgi:hypothetical protein